MERRIAVYQPEREAVQGRLGRRVVDEEVAVQFPDDFHLVAYVDASNVFEAWTMTLSPSWTNAPSVEWIDERVRDMGGDVFVAPGGETLHIGEVLAQ